MDSCEPPLFIDGSSSGRTGNARRKWWRRERNDGRSARTTAASTSRTPLTSARSSPSRTFRKIGLRDDAHSSYSQCAPLLLPPAPSTLALDWRFTSDDDDVRPRRPTRSRTFSFASPTWRSTSTCAVAGREGVVLWRVDAHAGRVRCWIDGQRYF